MSLTAPSIVAFAGHFLLACAIVLRLSRSIKSVRVKQVIVAAVFVLLLIRMDGLALAGYLRGIMGDLSVTSLLLLGTYVADQLIGRQILPAGTRTSLLGGVAAAGLILYPLALGLSWLDPYRLGYRPFWLLLFLLAAILWSWRAQRGVAVVLLGVVLAFHLKLLESSNLWDYLLDAWLAAYAWVWVGCRCLRHRAIPRGELKEPQSDWRGR